MSYKRISRTELYFELAKTISKRGTCPRLQVGVVLVRDGRVIASGYNGAPSGQVHCTDNGCDIQEGHCQRAVHAEEAAICFSAKNGIRLQGAEAYVTHRPCDRCLRLMNQAGIIIARHREEYP